MSDVNVEVLNAYLANHGWQNIQTTNVVKIWALQNSTHDQQLGVPVDLSVGSFEWSDAVRRIARGENRSTSAVELELEYATYDGIRFRIANEGFIGTTAPLHSGAALISNAYSMLRASATTAQRPRGQIGSGYSTIGDEYVRRARMAHTEQGSFIVPVLFEHDQPDLPKDMTPVAGTEGLIRESPQRRIVRTLAQTLETYKRRVIEPAKQVRQGDLTSVIAAGGSRELFASLERVLEDTTIAEFETRFSWSLTMPTAGNAPTSVSIPAEALDLVKQTVAVLTQAAKQPMRIFTGPIVAFEHEPGDPTFRIALQAPSSNGRMSRVYMTLRVNMLSEILTWIDGSFTVTVQGVVEQAPGRPRELKGISEPMKLDDAFLAAEPDGAS